MLNRAIHKTPTPARRHSGARGFTLVELMIGIVVGTIVIAAVIALYITAIRGATFVTQEARLTQETRIALDLMANDIRRAGYSHPDRIEFDEETDALPRNPFMGPDLNLAIHEDENCILLSYDPTYGYTIEDPLQALDEIDEQYVFGYRLAGNSIQMLTGQIESTGSCDENDGWETLTDPATTNVTRLDFSLDRSSCLHLDADGNTSETAGLCPNNGGDEDFYFENRRVTIQLEAQHAAAPDTRVSFIAGNDHDTSLTVGVRNARIFNGSDD
ncbi:prepilin-type N-terminal cleavage/methylation domain-containing protein [Thioalkalivibrio sp. ALE30]|uniref:prepilin-type N-terminal cleavage/methylation domain-containing protein n=1 Tax=Thioalkalivibrio sp. ALE30 TaxID=1158181 RepID=UPI000374D1A8|nr:prepilin-type N-terminal cleavage/methylation domain-containing protein [Thioalkalivibrio sp. ALE30]